MGLILSPFLSPWGHSIPPELGAGFCRGTGMCPCQWEGQREWQQGKSVLTARSVAEKVTCMQGLPVSPGIVGAAVGLAACRLANPLAAAGRVLLHRCGQPRTARPGHTAPEAWGCALEPLPLPASVHPADGSGPGCRTCWAFWRSLTRTQEFWPHWCRFGMPSV